MGPALGPRLLGQAMEKKSTAQAHVQRQVEVVSHQAHLGEFLREIRNGSVLCLCRGLPEPIHT